MKFSFFLLVLADHMEFNSKVIFLNPQWNLWFKKKQISFLWGGHNWYTRDKGGYLNWIVSLLPKSFHHIDINSIILAHVIHDAQTLLLKNIFLPKTLLCIWVAVNFNCLDGKHFFVSKKNVIEHCRMSWDLSQVFHIFILHGSAVDRG